MQKITMLGDEEKAGAYVLRLVVARGVAVRFGRFRGGAALPVPAGVYAYVGSALGGVGPRLLRHASRSQSEPHAIHPVLLARFAVLGLVRPGYRAASKRLHWHVDYLLEETAVDLTHVLVVRSRQPLEARLADLLLAETAVAPLAAGLGATDFPGRTHLLRIAESPNWWQAWVARTVRVLAAAC
ncbi:MAG: DUF123 domain-containing protein [Anaerolineales bacterium]|nr:DUF123 domain-containing protein [Anaerolineales bacterium]